MFRLISKLIASKNYQISNVPKLQNKQLRIIICLIIALAFPFQSCKKKKAPESKTYTVRYEAVSNQNNWDAAFKYSNLNGSYNTEYKTLQQHYYWTKQVSGKSGDRVYLQGTSTSYGVSFDMNVYLNGALTKTASQTFSVGNPTNIGISPEIDFILD
ncbi:MAG: hypothetical protein IPM51_10470 [Sphingobacteriaceae bacterium]|nr:hypothetical protein [Sphingobacteriaceae bacterium]